MNLVSAKQATVRHACRACGHSPRKTRSTTSLHKYPAVAPIGLVASDGCHAMDGEQYTYLARDVYRTCMAKVRTNIEIEDDYVRVIMDRYGVHTKTEAVDLALRHLAGQPMSRDEALAMRGAHAIGETPEDA